jgi:hypothetical protein
MDGAGPALSYAASVLGSYQAEVIAKHPQEGGIGFNVYRVNTTIDLKIVLSHAQKVLEF